MKPTPRLPVFGLVLLFALMAPPAARADKDVAGGLVWLWKHTFGFKHKKSAGAGSAPEAKEAATPTQESQPDIAPPPAEPVKHAVSGLEQSYRARIIPGTFPSTFTARTQEQCPDIQLEHEEWLGEVRNQQDMGVCFSYDVSREVGYCLNAVLPDKDLFGKEHLVSAMDLAFKYLRSEWDHKSIASLRQVMVQGGGNSMAALKLAVASGGLCSERELTSDSPSFRNRQKEIEAQTGQKLFPNEAKYYTDLSSREFIEKLLNYREQYTKSGKIPITVTDWQRVEVTPDVAPPPPARRQGSTTKPRPLKKQYKWQKVTLQVDDCLASAEHPCFGHLSIMKPDVFSNESFKKMLDETTDLTYFDELDNRVCSHRIEIPDACNGMVDYYTQGDYGAKVTDTRGYTLFAELDKQLSQGKRPVGIGVHADFLQNNLDPTNQSGAGHAMIAIGRRWKVTGENQGVCQYKIRNSWGVNEQGEYSKFVDAPYDGKADYMWLDEELLSKNLLHVYYITGKQQAP
jgi:hypothetical protein